MVLRHFNQFYWVVLSLILIKIEIAHEKLDKVGSWLGRVIKNSLSHGSIMYIGRDQFIVFSFGEIFQ